VVLGVPAAGALLAIVGKAVLVPVGASIGAGASAVKTGGTAAAAGTAATRGAVVIPLFRGKAAKELSRAAAAVIVAGTLSAGASEARAEEAVKRGMSNPRVAATLDITDDPFALSGGLRIGSRLTIAGLPYRVAALFDSR
jgi:hypothetical protein